MNIKRLHPALSMFVALAFIACKGRTPKETVQGVEPDSMSVVSHTPIYDRLLEELDSAEIFDGSILYGYWFKPHEACAVNIFFHKDGTFEFKYYNTPNDTTIVDVFKKGTFTVDSAGANNAKTVRMIPDDGWDEKFFKGVIQYKKNDTNYYLEDKESGLYLIKGSD